MWSYIRSILTLEKGIPRVDQIILISMIFTGVILYFLQGISSLALFSKLREFDAADLIKQSVDDNWIFVPSVLIIDTVFLALFISLYVIHRARKLGGVMMSSDGILHHHDQINISMRVVTLQTFLSPFAESMSFDLLDATFFEGGRRAGMKFAASFPETYRTRIQRGALGDWDSLSLRHRLLHWEKYDQQSGWGDIVVVLEDKCIVIQIFHPLLFRGAIGNAWAHFMNGYILAFLNEISKPRGHVTFDVSSGINNQGDYITLRYLLG